MKATEGNAGPSLVLHREPVPAPEIPRGPLFPRNRPPPGADRVTFDVVSGDALLTYHDVLLISDGSQTPVQVHVGPQDVVTWEWL